MPSVLITGATKGIGFETTKRLLEKGYTVYATARDPAKATELQSLTGKLTIIQLDVTEPAESIKAKINSLGKIDILINNAGIGLAGTAESATEAQSRSIFEVNYFGVQKVINAVLPGMRDIGEGKIINLSSVVGPLPDPFLPDYAASKAALETYAAVLRKNLKDAGHNITVANVQPGPVLTPFEENTPEGARFSKDNNPYPQALEDIRKWRTLMRIQGCPISETVDTIVRVIDNKNPDYWNPTNPQVMAEFSKVYKDTTGNTYMAGLTESEDYRKKIAAATVFLKEETKKDDTVDNLLEK